MKRMAAPQTRRFSPAGILVAPEDERRAAFLVPFQDVTMIGSQAQISSTLTSPIGNGRYDVPVKILLVDDHPENLLALEATLAQAGGPKGIAEPIRAEFIRARSGEEALRKVLQDSFAAILLDVQMPGMDGYETAELIRKRPQTQFTPIIFLTAVNTSDIQVSRGYALGAVDYITKPFDPWVLKAKIAVFVELYRKRQEIERMANELQEQTRLLQKANQELAATNTTLGDLYSELEGKSEELSKERDFADKILETAGSYIIIFDAVGRFERFNRVSETLSGLKAEQARGKHAWELLVAGEDVAKIQSAFEQVRIGKDISFEMTIHPETKIPRRLLMSFTGLYDEAHKLVNVIASGIDISERYEAEEKIRRMNEDLERKVKERTKELRETNDALWKAKETAELANSAKDKFLAVLSHELRTPLTPVLAIVQMLNEDPQVSLETKTWVETIGRNVQLEARLIDDLLDLTRIVNGKLELHLEPVDLHKLIRQTVDICDDEIRAKHQQLTLELQAENAMTKGDPARLQQVLWNLLKNAVKFTPEGGTIRIHTSTPREGTVRCEIADSGIGIPAEHLTSVFNAFDQGSKAITRRFGGLGLGLAISKALLEQHAGTICADSDGLNKGASFTIELPAATEMEAEVNGSSSAPEPIPHPRYRVLLVEDNEDTSRAMQVLLQRKGYDVEIARSVAAAIEVSQRAPFDLVVSDIGLPDGDGFEVIRSVNRLRPTRGIAISGYGMDEDRRKSRDAGFNAHLVKPINFEELSQIAQGLLEQK